MAIRFAQRVDGLRASEIREILKLTQRLGVISFAGGLPAPELFPVQELIEASREVLAQQSEVPRRQCALFSRPPTSKPSRPLPRPAEGPAR